MAGMKERVPDLDLSVIRKALGDSVPVLGASPVGRVRLMRALQGRFGKGFKNLPEAKAALTDFDSQRKEIREVMEMRRRKDGKRV